MLSERLYIIEQICHKKGYSFEYIDNFTQLLAQISSNHHSILISYLGYPLNAEISVLLAKDKGFTYLLLKKTGIKIPEGDYFFINHQHRDKRNDGKELLDAIYYAKKLGYPVFVKPLNGSFGDFACLINNESDLLTHCQKTAEKYFSVIIQRPVFQKEYRLFVIDDKVHFAYHKVPATIKADGIASISELINRFLTQTPMVTHRYKLNQIFINENLKKQNLTPNSVLSADTLFHLSPNANPNTGGIITDLRLKVSPACEKWAVNVVKTLGLRVCGIDFFTENSIDDAPQDFTVIELNSNPSLKTLYHLGYETLITSILEEILEKALHEN